MATVNGTKKISGRSYTITASDDGYLLELGPAATTGHVGTYVLQFNPTLSFSGQIQVQGRVFGAAAESASLPFEAIPYRRVTVAGVAQQYELVSDMITGACIIQVPANGMSVALLVSCLQGDCAVVSWDLNGPSAI